MRGERIEKAQEEIQNHLFNELLPFWETHGVDEECGGFLTYFDENGNPTGESAKTLVCQTRMIYTFASVHRAGLDKGKFLPARGAGGGVPARTVLGP